MEYTAYVAGVKEYAPEAVRAALIDMIAALGGIQNYVKPGQRVLVKPNLIARRFESQTHPVVIIEVARLFREAGAQVVIGDSTAWNSVIENARNSGLLKLAQEYAIPILELKRPKKITIKENRSLVISQDALDADVIVSVPKLKTHQQLKLTAGIKNMFGTVPGKRKALWHFRAGGEPKHFGRMLVRTYQILKPVLTIIDAVDAMEGRGPISGPLRRLGALIGSADGFAAELAACELVTCDPKSLLIMQTARAMHLGPKDLSEVQLLGADLNALKVTDFKFPTLVPIGFSLPRVLKSILKQAWLLGKEKLKR
jgi:uncharacterized protein (DUF362 family)